MRSSNKIYFIICGIVAQVVFCGHVQAQETQPSDAASQQEVVTGPKQHDMTLVSFDPWVVEGDVLGAVAAYVYDDVLTERPVDYWEFYNTEGDLLAVSWFDRFGIQRTAVDRGIVEDQGKLEGIFVVVLDGDLT